MRRLEWLGAAHVIRRSDGSRDAERLAERTHSAWIACVQQSLVMCFVKRTGTSVDDTSAAGVSCVRRHGDMAM